MTSTLKISEKGKLYKSETSDLMIMLQPNRGMNINEIYVKDKDSKHYYQLSRCGFSSNSEKYTYKCENPLNDYNCNIYVEKDQLFFLKNEYDYEFCKLVQNTEVDFYIEYVPLPDDVYEIESIHKINESYFVVLKRVYGFSYDSMKLFKITTNQSEELQITGFERYRDGGTTLISAIDTVSKKTFNFHIKPFDIAISTCNDIEMLKVKKDCFKCFTSNCFKGLKIKK